MTTSMLGFDRTLVAAVVARAPSYRRTAPPPAGPVAQSFRARIAMLRADLPCGHAGLLELGRWVSVRPCHGPAARSNAAHLLAEGLISPGADVAPDCLAGCVGCAVARS